MDDPNEIHFKRNISNKNISSHARLDNLEVRQLAIKQRVFKIRVLKKKRKRVRLSNRGGQRISKARTCKF